METAPPYETPPNARELPLSIIPGRIIIGTMDDRNNNLPALRQIIGAALPEGTPRDPRTAAALSLAYIGDTVYDLYVRTLLVEREDAKVHDLHLMSAALVCAAGQAAAYRIVEPLLSADEQAVYRRGRNAHMGTVAKNATIADYRAATGLEALVGYLYLSGQDARLTALMREIIRQARGRKES